MNQLGRNVRYGFRVLGKSPGFTLIAVLTLSIGIGANTAIFTVANALLLRPLPYDRPERLTLLSTVDVTTGRSQTGGSRGVFSFPRYQFMEKNVHGFSGIAAFTNEVFNFVDKGEPQQLTSARVSWKFFDVLGVRPVLGRGFLPEEDKPGGTAVVVIGYEFWTRQFAARPDVLGQSITLDSRPYTVVGVAPAGFQFAYLGTAIDIWTPRVFELSVATPAQINRGAGFLNAVGRLAPGTSIAGAQTEMRALDRRYNAEYAGMADADPNRATTVDDLRDQFVGNVRPAILILSCAVGLVLLIACANVAGLLLSRALGRKREMAIRTALGAGRAALVWQLLTESLIISGGGGALGIVLSWWGTRALLPVATTSLPRGAEIHVDGAVLIFSVGVSALTGLLFGLMPSLQISRTDPNNGLREESRGATSGRSKNRLRASLVVSQVALSLVLLIGAGLLIRSFAQLMNVGLGFNAQNLLTMSILLPPTKYPAPPFLGGGKAVSDSPMVNFYLQLARQAPLLPGVRSATLASALPVNPSRFTPMLFQDQAALPMPQRPLVAIQTVSPIYFETMRTPLIAGRVFTEHDDAASARVAIVNQTLAHRFWPNGSALGKHAYLGSTNIDVAIVGVVGDVKNIALAAPAMAEMYMPYPQLPTRNMNLVIRTVGDPHGLALAARHLVASLDPDQAVTNVQTMEELLSGSRAGPRFTMILLAVFSATALILAVVGLYGAISYSVAQRTQELGIRMALGAAQGDILGIVIRQGLILAGAGVLIGLFASLALTRLMSTMMFQVSVMDPLTFAGSALAFTAVALLASYIPARRATRLDPTTALRNA